jgi:hypothetical protein
MKEPLWWAYGYNKDREITCVHIVREGKKNYIPICGNRGANLAGQIEKLKDYEAYVKLKRTKDVCRGCQKVFDTDKYLDEE